ncbi:MAG: A/G-specific adenine glycosylase [Actinobacteria bacterium]|nr:A/G-specific adenine glycosylase [Actinomycetota bacterium]
MEQVLDWYQENKRALPWRNTSPWGVLVSEFMLQQTPVQRVLPQWHRWMELWPTPADLAAASLSDALREWGRLGYPRRAKRLHQCAQVIVTDHGGEVPASLNELRALPGIGEYTAAAIRAFAFKESEVVLDINIRRLYARCWSGIATPTNAPNNSERELAKNLIPVGDDGRWAAATMELGALICKARTPLCSHCPLADICTWRALGYPQSEVEKRTSAQWQGSDRQCRGVIMNALRAAPEVKRQELTKLWGNQSQYEKAIASLLDDGLIEKRGSNYALAR